MYVCMPWPMTNYCQMLVTNYCQILKRASEGIAERDSAGHTADGAFDLHHPMWIKSWQRLSPGARLYHKEPDSLTAFVTRSPTESGQEPDFFLHIKIFKILKLIKIWSYIVKCLKTLSYFLFHLNAFIHLGNTFQDTFSYLGTLLVTYL